MSKGILKLIGKEVQLFPGDTHSKYAKLVSWDKDSGYEFLITEASPRAEQNEGETWYYNNSHNMVMRLR